MLLEGVACSACTLSTMCRMWPCIQVSDTLGPDITIVRIMIAKRPQEANQRLSENLVFAVCQLRRARDSL